MLESDTEPLKGYFNGHLWCIVSKYIEQWGQTEQGHPRTP